MEMVRGKRNETYTEHLSLVFWRVAFLIITMAC